MTASQKNAEIITSESSHESLTILYLLILENPFKLILDYLVLKEARSR